MVHSAQIPPKSCLGGDSGVSGEGTGSAIHNPIPFTERVSAHEDSKTLKSGLAGSVGSPPRLLQVANSVSNSGSKTESTNLKREDLETQSQVKQQAFVSNRESGSCFLNPPRPDRAETEDVIS